MPEWTEIEDWLAFVVQAFIATMPWSVGILAVLGACAAAAFVGGHPAVGLAVLSLPFFLLALVFGAVSGAQGDDAPRWAWGAPLAVAIATVIVAIVLGSI